MGLVDLEIVKKKLGIVDDTQDDEIQLEIDMISTMIETIIGRRLDSTEYTEEKYVGTDTVYLLTSQYPIQSIESISLDDSEITDYELLEKDKARGKIYRETLWARKAYNNVVSTSPKGSVLQNIKHISVSYTAGYDEIPLDIQKIACDEVVRSWKGYDTNGTVSSWKLGNASESRHGSDVDLNSGFLAKNYNYLINQYKDVVII